jgi:hypothetical protein
MTIDKQDGRRFSGTFSSAKHSETVIAVISHAGTIYIVDDDGCTSGMMLAPDQVELCCDALALAPHCPGLGHDQPGAWDISPRAVGYDPARRQGTRLTG